MKKKLNVLRLVVSIFVATSSLTFFNGLLTDSMEYFYLSVLLGGPFILALSIVCKTESDLLIIFALAALVSGWLAPLGFFVERDKFVHSGFYAVKDFRFSEFQFIGWYVPVIAGYFLILLIAILPNLRHRRPMCWPFRNAKSDSKISPLAIQPRLGRKSSGHARLILTIAVFTFATVNWWMFNNSIGLTGISPPELPFKLSGILYYLARFVFPIILVFLLTRFRPTSADLTLVIFYACFASLTSVSKTTLFLLFIPALIVAYLNKKYIFLAFSLVALSTIYPIIGVARSLVYLVEDGLSIRNIDFSLVEILLSSFLDHDYSSEELLSGPLAIIERIGGGQDVALAAQYESYRVSGPLFEFIRLYIFDFWNLAPVAQELMYDYRPDVAGYATGDGGFFAHMLLAGGTSISMMFLVSLYLGIVLHVANSTYLHLMKCGLPRELVLFYAVLFSVFFFALSIPLWLNVFVVVTSVGSRTRGFRTFVKRHQKLFGRRRVLVERLR